MVLHQIIRTILRKSRMPIVTYTVYSYNHIYQIIGSSRNTKVDEVKFCLIKAGFPTFKRRNL